MTTTITNIILLSSWENLIPFLFLNWMNPLDNQRALIKCGFEEILMNPRSFNSAPTQGQICYYH